MIRLNPAQQNAVKQEGNTVVTACPGSGKTRVLTWRVIRGIRELPSTKHRVIALTYTNRAADEIQVRLDQTEVCTDPLWAGTIHGFALEWILRPYAPYVERIRKGFSIADEYKSEQILSDLKNCFGKPSYFDIVTKRRRNGQVPNTDPVAAAIFEAYQSRLEEDKLLDYDDVLFYAYRLLVDIPEVAKTLATIMHLICVDEIQDTQDLQYGILSEIFKASDDPPTIFFVGDADQSIYESLGAVIKTTDEIADEFGLETITHLELKGNYRSTQRIIDFYQQFRPAAVHIESLTQYEQEDGLITFQDQTVETVDLPSAIAQLIRNALEAGIESSDICVLAPHWWHVRSLGRALIQLLPDVDFDAPGLSPLHCQRDNLWFRIARLFLTTPAPRFYRTRLRWAREVVRDLGEVEGVDIPDTVKKPRSFLRLINSILSDEEEGLDYLRSVFSKLMFALDADIESYQFLKEALDIFFSKAQDRIDDVGEDAPTDVASFRKLFKHPSGVVISTCHGIKGEEYDTVIAFGLLRGYIPNWQIIINGDPETAEDQASKLLYVVCSRAKRRLHLIAETGRYTRTRNPYETATLLRRIHYGYDQSH